MDWLMENGVRCLEAAAMIVGGFAVLATMTENESDNKIISWVLRGINVLGMNFKGARNDT